MYQQTGTNHGVFADLLDDLRSSGDAAYAMRKKNFPKYRGAYSLSNGRSPLQIMEDTLRSARVQSAIEATVAERCWSRAAAEKEARLIAMEMAQCFDMKSVRPLAYLAKKVIPRLFSHVYVNRERFLQLKKLSETTAIIFMPTHRTYMDFILLQFLCFHYEINLPAIAAAVDFLNMKFMGEALRRCGAFFIRRQFGDDKLYWAIFSEYVENQLKHADRPLEFFIEGTRSRTGKTLHPKYGLLSVLLEPYFRNDIFDFCLVPVSVSFDRILEESLYAYELLGFPKPKESTSGLWKARTILNTDFGRVFVHAGEPISVRDYFSKLERPILKTTSTGDNGENGSEENSSIDRAIHALAPISLFEYSIQEQMEIRRLGHRVVKINEGNAVVGLWPLACIVMSKTLSKSGSSNGDLSYSEFSTNLKNLVDLSLQLKCPIELTSNSVDEEIQYYLKLHENILERKGGTLILKPVAVSVIDTASAIVPGKLIDVTVPRLMISNYANQAMHLYADLSFVCFAILKNGSECGQEKMFEDYCFLQRMFNREFISVPGEELESFLSSLQRLMSAGLVVWEMTNDGSRIIRLHNDKTAAVSMVASVIEPFLHGYHQYCDVFVQISRSRWNTADGVDEKGIVVQVQKLVSELLQNGIIGNFEILSSDMIKNCLYSLVEFKAIRKINGGITKFTIFESEVSMVKTKLWPFLSALDTSKFGNGVRSKL